MTNQIKPLGKLEEEIVGSPLFQDAISFGEAREGHPEKDVGNHISQILQFIDKQAWQDPDLRIIALLHDLGKFRVERSEKGNVIGKGHSAHSEDIARQFVSDERLLYLIGKHDKYFHFFRDDKKGKFKPDRFVRLYLPADLALLTRFNYADSCNREKESVKWFEDKCVELSLKSEKVYENEPGVLKCVKIL